jgi:hypothetical protein
MQSLYGMSHDIIPETNGIGTFKILIFYLVGGTIAFALELPYFIEFFHYLSSIAYALLQAACKKLRRAWPTRRPTGAGFITTLGT